MTFLNALTLGSYVAGKGHAPHVSRRYKLSAKIDEQIKLAQDSTYRPTKLIWHMDGEGKEHTKAVSKRIKRWWREKSDGTVLLTVRYGSRALELAKGKNAIVVHSTAELPKVLENLKLAVERGELDKILEEQTSYTKSVAKSKKAE
jgi:hypothetical protein